MRFVQTTGGQTGFPTPRRVRHEPYLQIGGPTTWTTLSLTIHADGRTEPLRLKHTLTADTKGLKLSFKPAPPDQPEPPQPAADGSTPFVYEVK